MSREWDWDFSVATDGSSPLLWTVRKRAKTRARKKFNKRKDALTFAKNLAKRDKVAVYVHDKAGQISSYISYRKPFN